MASAIGAQRGLLDFGPRVCAYESRRDPLTTLRQGMRELAQVLGADPVRFGPVGRRVRLLRFSDKRHKGEVEGKNDREPG